MADDRFAVVVEEGPARGGLYELEVDTTYRVLDRLRGVELLAREGRYSASFGSDGTWGPATVTGATGVEISADGREAIVHSATGPDERVPLPGDGD